MRRAARLVCAIGLLSVVAACSSVGGTSAASSGATQPSVSVAPTTSASLANSIVCSEVQAYFLSNITSTFNAYDPNTDEFDPKFGSDLRDEATHLFSFEAQSNGAVANAIHDEATGLTNISIAVGESDDSALASASNAANASLANLRGVCNF